MNGKNFSRTASAKFFTVYPQSEDHFFELASYLTEKLKPYSGPYILTDKRVPGSTCVYYRYGGHKSVSVPNGEGGRHQVIQNEAGEWVEDIREPGFYLPAGVKDPFDNVESASPAQISLKDGRYLVQSALHFSNSGGVYKAKDVETGRAVVLKEARKHAGVRDGATAQDALIREHASLVALADTMATPEPIDLFQEWESLFLVQEYIPMLSWLKVFAQEQFFLGPFGCGANDIRVRWRIYSYNLRVIGIIFLR
jgi:hypothetical protein